uniref:Uncharacterized protein n=1 Tax=Myoviridae sp. ctJ2i1 TaxID=2825079 RepID=A0A8S5V215_9CAUD|nr:MAG TPA: hypothetical protein [Myoviridae sp. ctJ2i1]
MIKYNIRNNGPWEYDKFVLNYYNLHNEIMLNKIKLSSEEQKNKQIDNIYNRTLEQNQTAKLYRKINYTV